MKLVTIAALFAFATIAQAQTVPIDPRIPATAYATAQPCPRCGQYHAAQAQAVTGGAQAVAQQRANYMARRNYKNHPPRSAGDWTRYGTFEGVGWSSGRGNTPTCTPRSRKQLVADATAYGPGGSYRVRIWR